MNGFDEEWLRQKLREGNVSLADGPRPISLVQNHPMTVEIVEPIKRAGKPWTQVEIDFARDILEPKIKSGEIVWWTDQVSFRLPGQTYTCDFLAMSATGEWLIYEIKGSYALGSQDRSSVKLRFLKSQLDAAGNVRVLWCKQRKDKTFRIREITNKRQAHPMLKEKG